MAPKFSLFTERNVVIFIMLHGEEIRFGEKQPSDLRQSCAQPSIWTDREKYKKCIKNSLKKINTSAEINEKWYDKPIHRRIISISSKKKA